MPTGYVPTSCSPTSGPGVKGEDSMETWDAIRARRNVRSYRTEWRGAGHIAGAAAAIAIVVPRAGDDRTRLVGLGYPADRPLVPLAKPDRRPLSEVIHHGRW